MNPSMLKSEYKFKFTLGDICYKMKNSNFQTISKVDQEFCIFYNEFEANAYLPIISIVLRMLIQVMM